MKLAQLLLVVIVGSLLSGCSVMAVRKYDPYFKNTQTLTPVKGKFGDVSVTGATPELTSHINRNNLSCRLTTFEMPPASTVASYISNALRDELDAAGKFDKNGKSISILVKGLDSDTSGFMTGTWTLDFDYTVAGKTKNVKTTTEFQSAYGAGTACRNTAEALQDAVRENLGKFFGSL
jgi:hypothetical protein